MSSDENGTASADPIFAKTGESVSLTASPTDSENYRFKEWEVVSGGVTIGDPNSANTTFKVGTANVEVKASFDQIPTPTPTPTPTPEPSKPVAKVSSPLLAKIIAKGNRSLVISWTKVNNADGYDVFFARCGEKNKVKLVKTIKGNKTFKWTKKNLKAKKSYRTIVRAWVMKDGKKTYVQSSPRVHTYTSGGTKKYTSPKKVIVNKAKVSLKTGKTYKIKAKVTKLQAGKKLMPKEHDPKLRYISSNKKIVTVTKAGKIKGIKKGSAKIYCLAQNGMWKTVKVTVK